MGGLLQAGRTLWPLTAAPRQKLHHLGSVCGLLPGLAQASHQLHLVVTLTTGLQEDRYLARPGKERNPLERLKEALGSPEAFATAFLEMSELAISSYKHVGRIRSARLVGRDLAAHYMALGEVGKAAAFLADGLKTFQAERWSLLGRRALLDLAAAHLRLGEREKFVRVAAQVAASGAEEGEAYHDQMLATLAALPAEERIVMAAEEVVELVSCTVTRTSLEEQLVPGQALSFSLVLTSRLPRAVTCSSLQVALVLEEPPEPEALRLPPGRRGVGLHRSPSAASSNLSAAPSQVSEGEAEGEEPEDGRLDIVEQLDYKQDKSLCAARLVCRNPGKVLRRKDSSGSILREAAGLARADYTRCLEAREVEVLPGTHTYTLATVAGPEGRYLLAQLSLSLRQLCLLAPLPARAAFTVSSLRPAVAVTRAGAELHAGLESAMVVSVHTGSCGVEQGTLVSLSCSRGLLVRAEGGALAAQAMVPLPAGEPFTTVSATVTVLADLANQKDSATIEHRLTVRDPWSPKDTEIYVHFVPAFYTSVELQTVMARKFLQVVVFPLAEAALTLSEHRLEVEAPADLALTAINEEGGSLVAGRGCEAGYLWQLGARGGGGPLRARFAVTYSTPCSPAPRAYTASILLQDYLTLYTVQVQHPLKCNHIA